MSIAQKILIYFFQIYRNLIYKVVKSIRKIKPYKSQIIFSTEKKITNNRIAIFSIHFDELILAEYIKLSCEELTENGYDLILIITYNSALSIDSVRLFSEKYLKSYYIIIRNNYGKDFGGFKDALKHIDQKKYDDIMLLNDSMIGPLFKSSFISDFDKIRGDVVGITDSYDIKYHLQSSFLKFSGKENINILTDFFEAYEPSNDRDIIVRYGEVQLSDSFRSLKKNLVPYVSTIQLWSDNGYVNKLEDNAQHAYWSELVFKYKVPFVKRELILSDPSNFLKNCNEKLSDESLDIIDDGLKFRLK